MYIQTEYEDFILFFILVFRKKVLAGLQQLYWKRKANHSFVINVLAQALYALFASSEGAH